MEKKLLDLCLLLFCVTLLCPSSTTGFLSPFTRGLDDAARRVACSNGYFQDFAAAAFECNDLEAARSIQEVCRTNSKGTFCVSDYGLDMYINHACVSSATTCPPECRDSLNTVHARLGCCIGIYNDSSSSVYTPAPLHYSLWSLCGVEPVTEQCAPSPINLSQIQRDPTCVDKDVLERIFSKALCRQSYVESICASSAGAKCGGYDPAGGDIPWYDDILDRCIANEAGQYCLTIEPSHYHSLFQRASESCHDTSSCAPLCTDTLNSITGEVGCCFTSAYNNTRAPERPYWLSYEFWSRCGLTSPGSCGVKLMH